jgi:hypothetical protein
MTTVPLLRLFVPCSQQEYRYYFFSERTCLWHVNPSWRMALWLRAGPDIASGFDGEQHPFFVDKAAFFSPPNSRTAPSLVSLVSSTSPSVCFRDLEGALQTQRHYSDIPSRRYIAVALPAWGEYRSAAMAILLCPVLAQGSSGPRLHRERAELLVPRWTRQWYWWRTLKFSVGAGPGSMSRELHLWWSLFRYCLHGVLRGWFSLETVLLPCPVQPQSLQLQCR